MMNGKISTDSTPASELARVAAANDQSEVPDRPAPRRSAFPVVAIGASAGGLDACRTLLDALSDESGLALILVQHLDPHHESMLVTLLATRTSMTVVEAADGMQIEPDHLYVIPPATYLSVRHGALNIVAPQERHGARFPFDFLLHSLASDLGASAVCVVLSGTGTDGTLGLKSIKSQSGLVIAQQPEEAGYDGMPRSAIATGLVDHVLPVAGIASALIALRARGTPSQSQDVAEKDETPSDPLPKIIALLRARTAHNFSLYKRGTLQRRIERRMALAAIDRRDMERYLEVLTADRAELDLLAKDLLINVTSFFRDPKVFEVLAATVIPDLVSKHSPDQPIRIWVAGCSTGEEAYSLAMLLHEHVAAEKLAMKLQVFASDVDPEAVAQAREGHYPETIVADVSAARLARFFTKEDHGYRVSAELRGSVVFTVQDLLADPPFSRLDLISCRNLLIYLGPEAQAQVITLFHFALRQNGLLLLGSSETVGLDDGRFEVVSKPSRLYRAAGRSRLHGMNVVRGNTEPGRMPLRPEQRQSQSRQALHADLCRRVVLETFAPAAVLINRKHEYLFSLGPTHRYLRVAQGPPTPDVLAMAPPGLRTKLRSAIYQAGTSKAHAVVAPGGHYDSDGKTVPFDINVQSLSADGEDVLLICFVDRPHVQQPKEGPASPEDASRVAELEHELEATRTELQGAIHDLEIFGEEQKAINQEGLSVNEELQSTNEELLTSKEELQSLNEELTALNTQLQETLDRQRVTANDLQNVLYSTDVATLFLDSTLNIRFFTPTIRSIFNVIAGDIGRPLADLKSLTTDTALTDDARAVLTNLTPIEREIETEPDKWFSRRILPYRNHENKVEGVVITFTDISERKEVRKALEDAKQNAEKANVAKTRFLAAASHDLRQPLQTMTLLQELLSRSVVGEKPSKLVLRLGETLSAMSNMLNTLLDINQIEAGVVRAEHVSFPINELFDRLREEFTYHAHSQKLEFRVIASSVLTLTVGTHHG